MKIFLLALALVCAFHGEARADEYNPSLIYRTLRVKAVEHCHNTDDCKEAYVQARSVGALTCTFTLRSEKGSKVEFDCALGRGDYDPIYDAMNTVPTGDSDRARKTLGGLICERSRSFWSGTKTKCVIRK
jgi:hypothetical protein